MREDLIHDALNHLDEDLIGEVEWLRSRKKKRNAKWIPWVAVAACFCIIFSGGYRMLLGGMKSDNAAEDSANMESLEQSMEANTNIEEENSPIIAENESLMDQNGNEEVKKAAFVLVNITAWETDGFHGKIIDSPDTDIYRIDSEVFVNVENATYEEYTVGSVVKVQVNYWPKDEKNIKMIYADSVELFEE